MATKLQNSTKGKTYQDFLKTEYKPIKRSLRGKALKEYLHGYKLSDLQKSILIGTLLGDASFKMIPLKCGGRNIQYKVEQKADRVAYVQFLYMFFKDIVGTPPQVSYKDGKPKSVWFRTYSLKAFDFYYDQFYEVDPNGKNRTTVPKLIHRWLNRDALAVWFMDDGTGNSAKNHYAIATHGFYRFESQRLLKAIARNFGLELSIWKDYKKNTGKTYFFISVPAPAVEGFTEIIAARMLPCMQYKIISR
jgi:hypothetical protein